MVVGGYVLLNLVVYVLISTLYSVDGIDEAARYGVVEEETDLAITKLTKNWRENWRGGGAGNVK